MILTILFRGGGEKVTILPGSDRLDGSTPLDDKVEGGKERLKIPIPLAQFGTTKSTRGGIGMTLQEVERLHLPVKLIRI